MTLFEGAGMGAERAPALLPLDDGSFIAGGAVSSSEQGLLFAWLGHFDPSGEPRWTSRPSLLDEADGASIRAVDSDQPQAGFWTLLRQTATSELLYYDSTGDLKTRLDLDELVDAPEDLGLALDMVVVNDAIWLAGSDDTGAWVGRVDLASQSLTRVLSEDGMGFVREARTIARDESTIAVAVTAATGPAVMGDVGVTPPAEVIVIRFDLTGEERGRQVVGAEGSAVASHGQALTGDGSGDWFVGGVQLTAGVIAPVRNGWVAQAGGWDWKGTGGAACGETPHDTSLGLSATGFVAETCSGSTTAAFRLRASDENPGARSRDGFRHRLLDPDGVARVEDLAVSAAQVIAVGTATVEGRGVGWAAGLDRSGQLRWQAQTPVVAPDAQFTHHAAAWQGPGQVRTLGWMHVGSRSELQSCLLIVE